MNNLSKPIPPRMKMILSLSTLGLILFSFNQCVLKPSSSSKKTSTSQYGSTAVPAPVTTEAGDIGSTINLPDGMVMPPMNTRATDTDIAGTEVGIKNFEQINNTMSQLTGVPTTDANVLAVFNDISIQLPNDNNVKNFLPSMQVAITKLATEYCDRTVETDTLRVKIWPTINFTQGPTQTLTATNKTALINQTVDLFLGPIEAALVDKSKTELLSLYDILLSGESMTSSATTKKVVKGVCVAALSSAYVTLL